jgi:phosphohistidine phosphatase
MITPQTQAEQRDRARNDNRRSAGWIIETASEVTATDPYLMRHGQARARAVALRVGHCVRSGKLRKEQTTRQLVNEIVAAASVEARPGLAPNDLVTPTAEWLGGVTEHQALVLAGHLPLLDRLASLLVAGDEDAQVVRFRTGGLVKLEPKEDRDEFAVVWAIPPDLA